MKQHVFLTADTHFSHHNILDYENRPFSHIDDMDHQLIRNWNQKVTDNDLVFHLGDVALTNAKRAEEVLSQLNGRKMLIRGNHDSFTPTKWRSWGFQTVNFYMYEGFLLSHIPLQKTPLQVAVKAGFLRGNIHGHTHSRIQHLDPNLYRCCCVELWDYAPVLFENFIQKTNLGVSLT